jgi:hypothetical protein
MTQKKKSNKVNKTFTKTVLPCEDVYIQFTDEEIEEFGWKKGQKFDFQPQDDGSFKLVPYEKIKIDLKDWPIELLHFLIKKSCKKDISVNDVINNILKKSLKNNVQL